MGSGMIWIRRLTWRVMLIHIGKTVPLIGRALQGIFFSMGSGVISLISRKQSCVALSIAASRVCCNLFSYLWVSMVEEDTIWFIWSLVGCYLYILQQPELCEVVREPSVPWQVKAYRDQVWLYQGYGVKRSSEAPVCCDERVDSWCVNQTIS